MEAIWRNMLITNCDIFDKNESKKQTRKVRVDFKIENLPSQVRGDIWHHPEYELHFLQNIQYLIHSARISRPPSWDKLENWQNNNIIE